MEKTRHEHQQLKARLFVLEQQSKELRGNSKRGERHFNPLVKGGNPHRSNSERPTRDGYKGGATVPRVSAKKNSKSSRGF